MGIQDLGGHLNSLNPVGKYYDKAAKKTGYGFNTKKLAKGIDKGTKALSDLENPFGGSEEAWSADSRPEWKGQLGSRVMPGTGYFNRMMDSSYKSPAVMQLERQRDQNARMLQSQVASQRGMSPASRARLAIMGNAQMNQEAAGQATAIQAQQQMGAAQQLNEQEMFRRKQLEAMMALEAGQYAGAQDRAQRERGAWMQMAGTGLSVLSNAFSGD